MNKFLATGISPNVHNSNYGVTLLHLAAAFKQKKKAYKMTKALLAQGATPTTSSATPRPRTPPSPATKR